MKKQFCVILVSKTGVNFVSVNATQPPDNSWAEKRFDSELLADEIVDLYTHTGSYLAVQKVTLEVKDKSVADSEVSP